MYLTPTQTILMILAITLGTVITRFSPFFLFPDSKEPPKLISYLGKVLPSAMMGLMVIYCLKSVSLTAAPHGTPELVSIALIIILHKWKGNVLLSIGGGTLLYIFLVQNIFV